MSIKTYVNGQENGAIAYKGDTEPCAVYVNGERQDNISYIPQEAEGVNSVQYTSEYKNNLRSLQIEGKTVQETHKSNNLFDQDWLLTDSDFTEAEYGGFDCIKAYPTSTTAKDFNIPTTISSGSTVSVSFAVAHPETGSNFSVRLLYEDGTTLAVISHYSTEVSSDYETFVATKQATKNVVGLSFSFAGIYANRPYYFKDIMFNIGEPLPYEPYVIPPSIANYQTIRNCGGSQVDVTLETRGENLFDYNEPLLAADSSSNLRNYSPKFENGVIYNGGNTSARGAFICIKADRESAYSITFDADFDEESQTYRLYRIAEFDTFSNGVFSSPHYESDITIKKGENVAIAVSQGYQYIGISFRSSDKYGIKITNLRIEKTVLKNEGEKFDFSVIPLRSFKEIGISEVTSDSVVITSTEIVPTNNNGYCGSGGIKLGAICPQLEVGKTYVLDFDNDKQEYCNEIVYLTKSGETSISWMKNNPLEITQKILDMTLVFFGYNIQKFPNALPLPASVTISNMVAKDMPIPYQRTTVSIPANVVLESGANDVLLELGGLGDVKDTISIDRVNNKVKYTQRICRVRPFVNVGGTLSYAGQLSNNDAYTHDVWQFTLNKKGDTTKTVMCEFAKVLSYNEVSTLDAETFGVVMPTKDFFFIYFPISLGITSTDALDSYIMQTSNAWGAGIFYVLAEPVEWSLPDYEASLLELARNTKNQTNIIEITSNPSVSKTSVNYAKWGGGESNV